jgi:hypothetical protein
MTQALLVLLLVLAAGTSAGAYILGGYALLAVVPAVVCALWFLGLLIGWKWLPVLCLFGMHALVVLAILLRCSSLLAVASAFFALLVWDLGDFTLRLRQAAPEDDTSYMQRRHLQALALVALSGVLVLGIALIAHIPLSFEWIGVLVLLGVWGIGKIIRALLQKKL